MIEKGRHQTLERRENRVEGDVETPVRRQLKRMARISRKS
jgi:hypothetical protein